MFDLFTKHDTECILDPIFIIKNMASEKELFEMVNTYASLHSIQTQLHILEPAVKSLFELVKEGDIEGVREHILVCIIHFVVSLILNYFCWRHTYYLLGQKAGLTYCS